jgi:hypothetical protein
VGKVVPAYFKMFWKRAVRWKKHQELTEKVSLYNLNRVSNFGITKIFPTIIKRIVMPKFFMLKQYFTMMAKLGWWE